MMISSSKAQVATLAEHLITCSMSKNNGTSQWHIYSPISCVISCSFSRYFSTSSTVFLEEEIISARYNTRQLNLAPLQKTGKLKQHLPAKKSWQIQGQMELQLLAIREMRASMLQTNLQENPQFPLVCTTLQRQENWRRQFYQFKQKSRALWQMAMLWRVAFCYYNLKDKSFRAHLHAPLCFASPPTSNRVQLPTLTSQHLSQCACGWVHILV